MKFLKMVGFVLVAATAGILIYAATLPDTFRVQRSITIQAPPEKVFPWMNDLEKGRAWSPWEKLDPNMKRTHSGPANGKGAVYAWDGNKDVGAGRMEIIESIPPSKVVMNLDFIRPMEGHNQVEYVLEPQGKATNVTWAMYGPTPYISKVICVFMNMDKMVGTQFEKGLADLKALVETGGAK
jgi:hypothetical protein